MPLFLLYAYTRIKANCPSYDVGPGEAFVICQKVKRVYELTACA